MPENASPYKGRPVKLAVDDRGTGSYAASETDTAAPAADPKPAASRPQARREAEAEGRQRAEGSTSRPRKPAFVAPGAPNEPLDEIALPARAKQLATWLESHRSRTPAPSTTGSTSTTGSSPAPASAGTAAPRRSAR